MSILDNLNVAISANKVIFDNLHPIDKIVATGTQVITNSGDVPGSDDPQSAKIQTVTIPNPYNSKAFVRFVWSIDGINFNAAESHLLYTFNITYTDIPITSSNLQGLKAAVSVAVSANTLTFQTANGDHGNVSTTTASPNSGYTSTSHTFTIKWSLYEMLPNGS